MSGVVLSRLLLNGITFYLQKETFVKLETGLFSTRELPSQDEAKRWTESLCPRPHEHSERREE